MQGYKKTTKNTAIFNLDKAYLEKKMHARNSFSNFMNNAFGFPPGSAAGLLHRNKTRLTDKINMVGTYIFLSNLKKLIVTLNHRNLTAVLGCLYIVFCALHRRNKDFFLRCPPYTTTTFPSLLISEYATGVQIKIAYPYN